MGTGPSAGSHPATARREVLLWAGVGGSLLAAARNRAVPWACVSFAGTLLPFSWGGGRNAGAARGRGRRACGEQPRQGSIRPPGVRLRGSGQGRAPLPPRNVTRRRPASLLGCEDLESASPSLTGDRPGGGHGRRKSTFAVTTVVEFVAGGSRGGGTQETGPDPPGPWWDPACREVAFSGLWP